MKRASLYLLMAIAIACNDHNQKTGSPGKNSVPDFIVREISFVNIGLSLRLVSADEIYADISYTNKSSAPFLFYRSLLPINGEMRSKYFSLFRTDNLDQVDYTGTLDDRYINADRDHNEGVIIPEQKAEKFQSLPPDTTWSFHINLAKYFDFSKIKKGSPLTLAFSEYQPVVDANYRQVYQKDNISNRDLPVYYYLTLPQNPDLDSMRIRFLMP